MLNNKTKVFVNGKWVGITPDPKTLTKTLKLYRQNGLINIFTSIAWNISSGEINILTDGGRCCRPLYILDDNKLVVKQGHINALKEGKIMWNNLVGGLNNANATNLYDCSYTCPKLLSSEESYDIDTEVLEKSRAVIEYIDTDENDTIVLKNTINDDDNGERYSHCEIHSSLIMGFVGFTIPFVNMVRRQEMYMEWTDKTKCGYVRI